MEPRVPIVMSRQSQALAICLIVFVLATESAATLRYGALELSGNFQTQNLVRHPSPQTFQFIQNRNTFQGRVEWTWVKNGKFNEVTEIPFIEESKLFLLYRGVYDGFYDLAPGGRQRGVTRFDDLVGGPIEGNRVGTCRDAITGTLLNPCEGANTFLREGLYSRFTREKRNALKIENELREVYLDFSLRDAPVSFRLGRQQVIWGESDQFRMMDIWNPLDLRWHLNQEPFERLRVPLWLAKFLWDTGIVGPFSNTFVELVYNPFDSQSGSKVDFLPRPWGAPLPNPLRNGQVQVPLPKKQNETLLPVVISPVFNTQGTSFLRGDNERNPIESSEIGGRVHGMTSQGISMTANYLYVRSRSIGMRAGSPFGIRFEDIRLRGPGGFANQLPDPELGTFGGFPVVPADVTLRIIHPYVHIFGFTANYFDGDYTQTVFRMETAYQIGAPIQTNKRSKRIPVLDSEGVPVPDPFLVDKPCTTEKFEGCRVAPLGLVKRDIWAGMVGFDRPTWIKPLNRRTTWLITAQLFWSYINGSHRHLRGSNVTASKKPYSSNPRPAQLTAFDSRGIGVWTTGPYAGITERLQDSNFLDGNSDNVRQWEMLFTLAATTFYKGGTIVPLVLQAFDPVNMNWLFAWNLDYFYTNDFIITLQQRFYTDFDRGQSLDPWGAGGLNNRRDESQIRLTYQF